MVDTAVACPVGEKHGALPQCLNIKSGLQLQ